MTTRKDPLTSLDEFTTKPRTGKAAVDTQAIEKIAEAEGFPSRTPAKKAARKAAKPAAPAKAPEPAPPLPVRRRDLSNRRSQQVNIKATLATAEAFYNFCDDHGIMAADAFEMAVAALIEKGFTKKAS
jgi:hypothetical protein